MHTKTKNFFVRSIILLCVSFLALAACSKKQPVLKDLNGQTIHFSQLRGRWIILNYWASWCENCVHEFSALNTFYQANRHKNVMLFGVNYDGLDAAAQKVAIKKFNLQYPLLLTDPASVLGLPAVVVLPTTFVINPQGKLVATRLGSQTLESLTAAISNTN